MLCFICPVCKKELIQQGNTYACANGHSFDRARRGYVNLLMSQKSSGKRHGDDKLMVRAREHFLNMGYYTPLLTAAQTAVLRYVKPNAHILDVGCGECWYTANIYRFLMEQDLRVQINGIDISKEALAIGAKRCDNIGLAVASVSGIPASDASCDMILNFFAPYHTAEFLRVLKNDGVIIRAVVLENHLWGLKKAVYDNPYKNKTEDRIIDGFTLIDFVEVKNTITLNSKEEIDALFKMTPYYYKTGVKDQQKLNGLTMLTTETEFGLLIYKKDAQ